MGLRVVIKHASIIVLHIVKKVTVVTLLEEHKTHVYAAS